MSKKQHEKSAEKRTKAYERYIRGMKKAQKKWQQGTEEVEEIERRLDGMKDKAEQKMAGDSGKAQKQHERKRVNC